MRFLILLLVLISIKAVAELPEPIRLETDNFNRLYQIGDAFVSGQPTEAGMAWLKTEGIHTVINIRTDREKNNREIVPFDEKERAQQLGLGYVEIPLGGDDTPYTPGAVAQVIDAIEKAGGKVALHCASGRRASHVWAAYLIRGKGVSVPDAVAYTSKMNFGSLPLEGLLGEKLIIDVAP